MYFSSTNSTALFSLSASDEKLKIILLSWTMSVLGLERSRCSDNCGYLPSAEQNSFRVFLLHR